MTRIHASRESQAEKTRESILEAMLEVCGEKGYRRVAVQDLIDRYGGNRVQFYRYFSNKAECYATAHDVEIARLSERVLGAARAESEWRSGLRTGLDELARFAEQRPLLVRGLLVEVHVAGGPALRGRAEACTRFADAIDGGRREAGEDRSPPAITAQFMVGAIESTLSDALTAGDPQAFTAAVPELTYMVVSAYLGEAAAGKEMAAAA